MGKDLIRSSVFLEEEQAEELRKLSYFTRNSMATYIREGIDLVLNKYKGVLTKAEEGMKKKWQADKTLNGR